MTDAVAALGDAPWWAHLTMIVLACARLTRLVVEDRLTDAPREWVWKHRPPDQSYVGYLLTCEWCTSVWVATALTAGWWLAPTPTVTFAAGCTIAGLGAWLAALID